MAKSKKSRDKEKKKLAKRLKRLVLHVDVPILFRTIANLFQLMQRASGKGTTAFGRLWKLHELMEDLPGHYVDPVSGNHIWGLDLDNPDVDPDTGRVEGYKHMVDEAGVVITECDWRLPKHLITIIWSQVCEPVLEQEREFRIERAIREVCEAFADYGLMTLWDTATASKSPLDEETSEGLLPKDVLDLELVDLLSLAEDCGIEVEDEEDRDKVLVQLLRDPAGFDQSEEDVETLLNPPEPEEKEEESEEGADEEEDEEDDETDVLAEVPGVPPVEKPTPGPVTAIVEAQRDPDAPGEQLRKGDE